MNFNFRLTFDTISKTYITKITKFKRALLFLKRKCWKSKSNYDTLNIFFFKYNVSKLNNSTSCFLFNASFYFKSVGSDKLNSIKMAIMIGVARHALSTMNYRRTCHWMSSYRWFLNLFFIFQNDPSKQKRFKIPLYYNIERQNKYNQFDVRTNDYYYLLSYRNFASVAYFIIL